MIQGNWPNDDPYNPEPMLDVQAGFLSWAQAQYTKRERHVVNRTALNTRTENTPWRDKANRRIAATDPTPYQPRPRFW